MLQVDGIFSDMRRFFSFWQLCVRRASRGNAAFANEWQWLIGYPATATILWILGYFYAELSGRIEVTLSTGALGALAAAFIAYMITWVGRLLNAPVILYDEQKDRADKLEGLRQIANDVSRASFDLGFEYSQFEEQHTRGLFPHHQVCRIWAENLENRPISDRRIVIEDFRSDSPILNGALLLPDHRGADDETSAGMFFAATERRYFKFLEVHQIFGTGGFGKEAEWEVAIRSDQDDTGLGRVLNPRVLKFGQRYFATVALHGSNANSQRINLSIDLIDAANIIVTKSAPEQRTAVLPL
jgi:hypothetical protein